MSTILLLWTQSFFGRVLRSAIFIQWLCLSSWSTILLYHCSVIFWLILLRHFMILLSHFYCYTTKLFSIAHCSIIFYCYSAQPFCYSTQTFLRSSVILHAIVLNHCSLIFSAQPFFIEQGHSSAKWLSRTDEDAYSFTRSYCSTIL
jgi:hypothetical protein